MTNESPYTPPLIQLLKQDTEWIWQHEHLSAAFYQYTYGKVVNTGQTDHITLPIAGPMLEGRPALA